MMQPTTSLKWLLAHLIKRAKSPDDYDPIHREFHEGISSIYSDGLMMAGLMKSTKI
jgi:hypothetical protein